MMILRAWCYSYAHHIANRQHVIYVKFNCLELQVPRRVKTTQQTTKQNNKHLQTARIYVYRYSRTAQKPWITKTQNITTTQHTKKMSFSIWTSGYFVLLSSRQPTQFLSVQYLFIGSTTHIINRFSRCIQISDTYIFEGKKITGCAYMSTWNIPCVYIFFDHLGDDVAYQYEVYFGWFRSRLCLDKTRQDEKINNNNKQERKDPYKTNTRRSKFYTK